MSRRQLFTMLPLLAAVAFGAALVLRGSVARATQTAQAPAGVTQLLFEQAVADEASRAVDASSVSDIRLVARASGCPTGATFDVALFVVTAAGPTQLERNGVSCSDGLTKTYERIVGIRLAVAVTNRRLADGTSGAFPVDVAVLGRS
jgi:hypothetical protein